MCIRDRFGRFLLLYWKIHQGAPAADPHRAQSALAEIAARFQTVWPEPSPLRRDVYKRQVLSVAEASRFTGYHHNTLTNWCHNGYIRYFEISGGYMIPKSCLLNFLDVYKRQTQAYTSTILEESADAGESYIDETLSTVEVLSPSALPRSSPDVYKRQL